MSYLGYQVREEKIKIAVDGSKLIEYRYHCGDIRRRIKDCILLDLRQYTKDYLRLYPIAILRVNTDGFETEVIVSKGKRDLDTKMTQFRVTQVSPYGVLGEHHVFTIDESRDNAIIIPVHRIESSFGDKANKELLDAYGVVVKNVC